MLIKVRRALENNGNLNVVVLKMKKSYIKASLFFAVILFIAGYYLYSTLNRKATPTVIFEDTSLAMGIIEDPVNWLVLVAQEGGFFQKYGLSPSIHFYPSGKRALQGLLDGTVDITSSSEVPIALAGFRRKDFRILAAVGSSDDEVKIVSRKDHGVFKPADLAGKHIATQSGSAIHFFMHLFLLKNGIDNEVKRTFMLIENLPGALHKGTLDAISTREPFVTQTIKLLGENAIIFSVPGLYRKSSHLVIRKEILDTRPGVVTALHKALLDAGQWIKHYPEKAVKIITAKTGIQTGDVEKILQYFDLRLRFDQSTMDILDDTAEWAVANGLVEQQNRPNYLLLIDPGILSQLAPTAVSVIYSKDRHEN